MKLAALTVALGAVCLTGCVSMSRSQTVSSLSPDLTANARIESIRLTRGDLKVTPEFNELFRSRVKAKLDACAKGTRPLRLEASINRFDKANPVITTLVAGANVLRGEARLIDLATGQVVAVYQIGHTVVGGRVAILKMGEAEEQLSDAFGQELCQQAFPTNTAAR